MISKEPIGITFIYKGKALALLCLVLFLCAFYILYVLKPNGVSYEEQKVSYFFTCLFQSVIPIFFFVTISLVVEKASKARDKWNVIYEMLFFILILVLSGLTNFLVRDIIYINENNWSWGYFIEEIVNGFKIGIIVGLVIVAVRTVLELWTNLKKANLLQSKLLKATNKETQGLNERLTIVGSVKSEVFNLLPDELIFARAAGNYVDIYILYKDEVKKLTKRLSLSSFLSFFADHSHILRIHNSYIVNLEKISQINGNAGGLFLKFDSLRDIVVPVSRKYIKEFEEEIQRKNGSE